MSSSREINFEKYELLCKELNIHILKNLKWVSIKPTLHKLLAHSADVIKNNQSRGLKEILEEGLETTHKRLQENRINGARKHNQKHNLIDLIGKGWIGSGKYII